MINPKVAINDPAFPLPPTAQNCSQLGMTYHQWLVGQAVCGLSANHVIASIPEINAKGAQVAREAVVIADAVFARLNKEK